MTIDTSASVGVRDTDLHKVRDLTGEWQSLQTTKEQIELRLKAVNERIREIEEQQLPDAMATCGITTFRVTNGAEVEVKRVVAGTCPTVGTIEKAKPDVRGALQARREFILAYLRSHGHHGIIKTEVTLGFGKGEFDRALKVVSTLRDQGYTPELEQNVHPATFVAWAKEVIDQGTRIPDEFGLYIGPRAKIHLPK